MNVIRISIISLIFFFIRGDNIYPIKTLEKRQLLKAKQYYLPISSPNQEDVEKIFDSYPMYTNIVFRISKVDDDILDKMFTDLDYTGRVGKAYAGSPYTITRKKKYFHAQIKNVVDGTLHPLKINKEKNQYIYFVKGYYDTFITLRGKMIVDIKYTYIGAFVNFNIKTYIIIDNTYMWRLARYLKSVPAFQKKIDKVINANIRGTIRLGMRTVAGIKRDLKSKNF